MKRILLTALLVAAVHSNIPVASAQIVLPGTQPGDLVNWPLIQPSNCNACHASYVAGRDYEPFDSWAGSMMANSSRDPLFWAALDVANQDEPGIGEFCIRCHSPRAWLEGRSSTPDGSAMLGYPDEPDNDFEGIDCHFCHRMFENNSPFTQNGQYWIDDGTPGSAPPRRGPFTQTFAPHPTARSEYHDSSQFCGTCHDLRSPVQNLLDASGADTGRMFPEQTTYSEWAQSAFATENIDCQDCHMPPAEVSPAFACNSFNPQRPAVTPGDTNPVFRHDLSGANSFMLTVLKGQYAQALDRHDEYQAGIDRAIVMLQSAASIEIQTDPIAVEGDSLAVEVRVTNLSGHKLPTGYPEGRRMWVELVALDALGMPFFVSGDYDDATATLNPDPQLHTYEADHGVQGEGGGFHLARNNRIFGDTRIPPRGFVPNADTAPVGRNYPMLPDSTLASYDDVSYLVPVPQGVIGPVQVRATLRYQTAAREYIEFLRDENASGPDPHDRNYPAAASRGQKIHDYWSAYGQSAPVDMTTIDTVVPSTAPPAAVAGLVALPGHGVVNLGWNPLPLGVSQIRVLRKAWGDYPELGSNGSSLPEPTPIADYDDALAAGWVPVYTGAATSFADNLPGARDVFLYGAWHFSGSGVQSAGTFLRGRNYRIGDVGEVGVPDAYDGLIDGPHDLPVFSLAWGTAEGQPGFNPVVDFAPTDTGSRFGISEPDDAITFQDLVIFSLQYGTQPAPAPGAQRSASGVVVLSLERSGNELIVRADEHGDALHALALQLPRDCGLKINAITGGSALPAEHFAGARSDDEVSEAGFALLGVQRAPSSTGLLMRVRVDGMDADLLPAILLDPARWTAIGHAGEPVEFLVRTDLPVPRSGGQLALSPPFPNPFNPRTRIELSMPADGLAEVVVYDLAGRRVRTLLRAELDAGDHSLIWDGMDERGRSVASGTYLIRAEAAGRNQTQRAVLVR